MRAHRQLDNLEKKIQRELGIACTIHMDPIVTDDETANRLRAMTADAVTSVDRGLSIHDFRCVVGQTHTNLIFDLVVPFENKTPTDQLCAAIENKLRECGAYYAVITVDRG